MEPACFPSSMPQTELAKTKKSCLFLPKRPSFNATTERTAHYSICESIKRDLPSLSQNITGAFPLVSVAIFILLFSTHTPASPTY